jgi:hypothetical protein
MKTQIIQKAETKKPGFKIGQTITFKYETPLQNIGWRYEQEVGVIMKVNRVTVHVCDFKDNTWKVRINDILEIVNV